MGKIYQIFKSRKLAIGLLFLLSGISILSTIFNRDEVGSKMLSLDPSTWLSYFETGAFSHSPVFISVMGLLFINLTICTYDRLKSNWGKLLKTFYSFDDGHILNLPFNILLKKEINRDLTEKNLFASGYKIYKNEGIFYGEKGKIHLWGTYITHICIILVIIAGTFSALFSYVGTVGIFEKQETDTYYNWMEKKYKALPFKIRVEKLDIIYYNPSIELEIRDKKDIKKYSLQKGEGIFYQNDKIVFKDFLPDSMVENNEVFSISEFLRDPGVLFKIYQDGKDVYNYWIFKDIGYKNKIEPAYTINILSSQYLVKSSESILNIIENGEVKFRDSVRPNKSIYYKGLHIYFWGFNQDEYRNYFTGLQISYDPSLWLTWIALAGILCGLCITFLVSYDRVWIKYSSGQILIGGKTGGDKDKFVKKMQKLVNELEG
ncbi:MAG: cytochrome c biogenesis protein ResB [bacterium]|nr:cytochrome c biogenesis protein ResB [bacterium]